MLNNISPIQSPAIDSLTLRYLDTVVNVSETYKLFKPFSIFEFESLLERLPILQESSVEVIDDCDNPSYPYRVLQKLSQAFAQKIFTTKRIL